MRPTPPYRHSRTPFVEEAVKLVFPKAIFSKKVHLCSAAEYERISTESVGIAYTEGRLRWDGKMTALLPAYLSETVSQTLKKLKIYEYVYHWQRYEFLPGSADLSRT